MKLRIMRIDDLVNRPDCRAPGCNRTATVSNHHPDQGEIDWRGSADLMLCTDCGMRLSESLLSACSDLIRGDNKRGR